MSWLFIVTVVSIATTGYPGITSHPETVNVTVNSDDVGFGINLKGEQDVSYQCDIMEHLLKDPLNKTHNTFNLTSSVVPKGPISPLKEGNLSIIVKLQQN